MENEKWQHQIVARLDIIVRLLLGGADREKQRSITEMAVQLDDMGLAPSEIGAILSKPSNYISAALNTKKKGKGRTKKDE